MRISSMVRRLLSHWHRADDAARAAGSTWYATARAAARDMAREHGTTVRVAAGVIAALSPRLTWSANVRAAREVLARSERVPGVFRASLAKARAILDGARPLATLGGPKVRAFYRALCGDESAAVVDVWTVRAALGAFVDVTERVYALVSAALARAASRVGTTTARLQAVAWVVQRGRAS